MTKEKLRSMIKNKNRKYLKMHWSDIDRMLDKFIFPEDNNKCWGWTDVIYNFYPTFSWQLKGKWEEKHSNGRIKEARNNVHRILEILINGPIDKGLVICHKRVKGTKKRCRCPNPKHFKLGTQQKNMKQMVKDGKPINTTKML